MGERVRGRGNLAPPPPREAGTVWGAPSRKRTERSPAVGRDLRALSVCAGDEGLASLRAQMAVKAA